MIPIDAEGIAGQPTVILRCFYLTNHIIKSREKKGGTRFLFLFEGMTIAGVRRLDGVNHRLTNSLRNRRQTHLAESERSSVRNPMYIRSCIKKSAIRSIAGSTWRFKTDSRGWTALAW